MSRRSFLGAAALVLAGCGKESGGGAVAPPAGKGLRPGAPITGANAGQLALLGTFPLGDAEVVDLAFSAAGSLLICGADDGRVHALNLQAGASRAIATDEGRVWAVAAGSQSRVLWGGDDGVARAAGVAGGEVETVLDAGSTIFDIAFAPSGDAYAIADGSGRLHVGAAGGGAPRAFDVLDDHALAAAWDPSGRRIACASHGGEGAVLDARSGRRLARLRYAPDDHGQGMNGICWVGADMLASASQDGIVRLWSAAGRPLRALPDRDGWRRPVRLAPTAPLLADGGQDGFVRFSDPIDGRVVAGVRAGEGSVWGLEFSPAGRLLAAACSDGQVRVYGLRAGTPA